jgi:hypothetical protein
MADQNCWKLTHPGGHSFGDDFWDGEPHFTTREDALEALPAEGSDAIPVQMDHPCVYVDCAGCETQLDAEDENWIVHFDNRAEALLFARDYGWTVRDDSAWCPAEECTAASKETTR